MEGSQSKGMGKNEMNLERRTSLMSSSFTVAGILIGMGIGAGMEDNSPFRSSLAELGSYCAGAALFFVGLYHQDKACDNYGKRSRYCINPNHPREPLQNSSQ